MRLIYGSISIYSLIFIIIFFSSPGETFGGTSDFSKLVFVLSVSDQNDIQTSELLIKSIRENGENIIRVKYL